MKRIRSWSSASFTDARYAARKAATKKKRKRGY
jgi:hypothetical protein